jgi:hypothetical protein
MPGIGHPEYNFVQGLMEVQKSLATMNANLEHLTKTVDSTKSKVEDLVKWKSALIGGAITIGAMLSMLVYVVKVGAEYVALKIPNPPAVMQQVPAAVEPEVPSPPRSPSKKH